MPTILAQGQTIEVNTTDYYLHWHRFVQSLDALLGYFFVFPTTEYGEREFEDSISFLRTNLEKFEDAELREQAIALIEVMKPLPLAHKNMVNEVVTQLKITNPQSPSGKRQLTMKWRKLIAGQAPTEEMKQAIKTLQDYANWYYHLTQEVTRNKEQFLQHIENLYPEVKEQLRNS